jgi:type IV secretory pathway component VirB8
MGKKKSENTTPRVSLRGVNKWLSAVEVPRVQNSRLTVALFIVSGVALVQGIGLWRMLPLKERVPYVVKEEIDSTGKPTGHIAISETGVAKFQVSETHVRYYLREWVGNLLSVDESTERLRLPASYKMLRGAALQDWQRYVKVQAKPIEALTADSSYRVKADLISINFIVPNRTAMLRVQLTDNKGMQKRVVVNLDFAFITPSTDEEVYRNPIGLWITSFGVSNELA